jgi:plasmid stabilization system protein ParE
LGYFDSEEAAARKFDHVAGNLGRAVNFPEDGQKQAVKRGGHGVASRFTGVTWHAKRGKWLAQLCASGKTHNLGYWGSEEEAARKYDVAAKALGRPVNFPVVDSRESIFQGVTWHAETKTWLAEIIVGGGRRSLGVFTYEEAAARAYDKIAGPLGRSVNFPDEKCRVVHGIVARFIGVTWYAATKKWLAQIYVNGQRTHLGYHSSEEAAAQAYDDAASALGRPVNFPGDGQERAVKRGETSKYRGVYFHATTNNWRAGICVDGRQMSLGYFNSEVEGSRAYDHAAGALGRPVNVPDIQY